VAAYRFGDSAGMLYQAETDTPSLPDGSEMAEVILRTLPPEPMTWPELQPAMFRRVQNWLNICVTGDELWDVYDENRRLTGRTMRRGDPIAPGDRHLGVHVWLRNADGSYLITRRSPIKGYSLLWECTGGSALAGEDSLTAAIREVAEETGLTVTADQGERLYAFTGGDCFSDVWLFRGEFRPEEVVLQEGETCAAKVVPKHQLLQMMASGEMISYSYAPELP